MEFRTKITIERPSFTLEPADKILFVGSCFAENIGRRFAENRFNCTVNPYGTMYNPASVLHTVERIAKAPSPTPACDAKGEPHTEAFTKVIVTLGTNHVYILKETGEIVDNCMKRPQRLFHERELTIEECAEYLREVIEVVRSANGKVDVIFTVSPIRYAKYGYHESQLSKATLLLAVERVIAGERMAAEQADEAGQAEARSRGGVYYFPSYEIVNDELRDYRFYAPDMIHPSEQAVDYIYERFAETIFSASAHQMVKEWRPIKAALAHRPFNPDNEEYKKFLAKAKSDEELFITKWFD